MQTRRSLRSLNSKPNTLEGQISGKRNAVTSTDEPFREHFQEAAQIGQAPVFNIHIHLPENYDRNGSKMYLPRIQPVIHVHFDELAREFKYNLTQNRGLNKTDLQNKITQATPTFGSVLFHCKTNSIGKHFTKNGLNTISQKQAPRDKNSSVEFESNGSSITETVHEHNSEITDQCCNNSCNGDAEEKIGDELPKTVIINGHPVKLKKAVVVLKDICKSNSYKRGVNSDLFDQQKNQSSSNSTSSLSKIVLNSSPQMKMKSLSSSPRSDSPDESEKSYVGSGTYYANPLYSSNCSVNFESPSNKKLRKRESLTSLIEGCNFSEILRRFREKSEISFDYLEKPSISAELENEQEDKKLIHANTLLTQEPYEVDQSLDIEEEEQEIKKNNDETSVNEIKSFETPSPEENGKRLDIVARDDDNECSIAEIELDKDEFTTGSSLYSNVDKIKIVECDSSIYLPNIIINGSNVIKEDQYVDFKLMGKEMLSQRKEESDKLVNYKKRGSQDLSEKEFSPKKIKQTPQTPKKSEKESHAMSTMGKGYIPLKIPGPTEFAVAPLPEVQSSKEHNAKKFKEVMLLGKRVNRFSSPDHLRIYKLKKEAAGRCNK